MSTSTVRTQPNLIQRVEYLCGRHLPDSMHDWVVNDTTGPGHNRRYFFRGFLMSIPLLVVIAVLPIALWIKVVMVAMVLLPGMFFLTALRPIYLQELMIDNDVDPHTVTGKWAAEHERQAAVYSTKFRSGPRKYA
jgi:hypothetical protein